MSLKKVGKAVLFGLDFIWELPQNIAGLIVLLFKCRSVKHYPITGYYTVEGFGMSACSLGLFIIADGRFSLSMRVLEHEKGHQKQSHILGWLYLPVIGLPSFLHALWWRYTDNDRNYYGFYTEAWANRLMGITMT